MQLLTNALDFINSQDAVDLFYYFWFFLVFDFSRYVLADTFFLMVYFFKKKKNRPVRVDARLRLFKENPLISIIVPGKNEGRYIPELAKSLNRQTYKNIETIIVDDGSDDNTFKILRKLKNEGKIDSIFRNDVRGGKASAANLALMYSNGKYVVHLDADTHLKEDSVEQIIIPFYMDSSIGAVGGDLRVKNIYANLATSLQSIDYMKSISTGRVVNSQLGILRIISGAFGAFRKDVLDQIKGWDVGPGLDGDLTLKIRKLGLKVKHEPEAVCYTSVPDSFIKLIKQRYRWDRSLVRFRLRKHSDLLSFKNRNFNIFNFLTVVDNLLFNMVMNFKWWIYIFYIIFLNPKFIAIIFVINYLLYFSTNVIEFILATKLYGKTMRFQEYMLIIFLPLMPLYHGIFLRLIRTYAHIMEIIHRSSFEDKWNPWKVSKVVKKQRF
ncbi:MAG: glycosyltransferase family 2 protein [Desulfobacterales bacterium]|nr:glycosyltransferase family 2 protein [Desulfobacterales bacterium]MCP4164074.1 glycosyltransferase family 2 protein [Deltaproteobacteria bacterium]